MSEFARRVTEAMEAGVAMSKRDWARQAVGLRARIEELEESLDLDFKERDRNLKRIEELERIYARDNERLAEMTNDLVVKNARIKELESKLNNHRQFISWLTVEGTQYGEEWEELAKSGLVVEVKPTPEFIDEWGDESEMYVLAWKAHEFEPVEVP